MTFRFRRFSLLAFATISLAAFASVASAEEAVYTVKCRYYYQDAAVLINPSVEFVTPIGYLGKYLPGEGVTFTCSPTKIPTLECARGYYVSGWDLDDDWGDKMPGIGGFTPSHRRKYGAVNPLTITFSSGAIGVLAPTTCDLVPHLAMMHYTLAYDANGGTFDGTAPTNSEYYYSADVTALGAVCSRAGYTFTGWNTSADGTGVAVSFNENVNGDTFSVSTHLQPVVLFAQWQATPYALRLRPGTGIDKIFYKASPSREWKSTAAALDVPVAFGSSWQAYATAKSGYTYTAYTAEKPNSGVMGLGGAEYAPEAAANVIRVSYDGNGKTAGAMTGTDFVYNQAGKLADLGYTRAYTVSYDANYAGGVVPSDVSTWKFLHWNNRADGTGSYSYADGATVMNPCGSTGGAVTLYAQWQPVPVTLPSPVRTGCEFLGWYADRAGAEFVGRAGELYCPTGNVKLYAKWNVRSYTVTFVDKTGSSTVRTEAVAYGGAATAPTAPTREGERFTKWSSDAYGQVTGDLVIRAEYETVKYHVTYNSNYADGRSERSVLSVGCGPHAEYSDRITLLDVGDKDLGYSKTGYRFLGWAWAADAVTNDFIAGSTVAWSQIADHAAVTSVETQSANLYAVWQPITTALVYHPGFDLEYAGDYDGGPTNQTLVYDRPARLLANPYRLDNQHFLGWSVSPVDATSSSFLADQQLVTNLARTAGVTLTLTALWDGNGDHTVLFEGNGATNVSAYTQGFVGSTSQPLASNQFARVGYEFMGWETNYVTVVTNTSAGVTNIVCTTNWSGVVYRDRASYLFSSTDVRFSTNTLYAVWEPTQYTIIFNTGTNGVTGTMDPVLFSGTNETVTFANLYNRSLIVGDRVKGWTRLPNSEDVVFPASEDRTIIYGISNLVDSAEGCITLYAIWGGLSDLSKAVGLTNAVLTTPKYKKAWQIGSDSNSVVVAKSMGKGTYEMSAKVSGPGIFKFAWKWDLTGRANFTVITNGCYGCPVFYTDEGSEECQTNEVVVADGENDVTWCCEVNSVGPEDMLSVNYIRWEPSGQPELDWKDYHLFYTNTMGATPVAPLPKTYAVTNETFAFAPLEDIDGYEFVGWAPSNIVQNTTGDITVKAMWRVIPYRVEFDLADLGEWVGGGELEQAVERGFDAVEPKVAPSNGWTFVGWDKAFTNVTSDLVVTALYERIAYRIDYENTLGVVNTNRLGFTIDEIPVSVGPLDDTRDAVFNGWVRVGGESGALGDRALPGGGESGYVIETATNVVLRANWRARTWLTVRYELGDHLARTGGGALEQSILLGSAPAAPSVQADEGYDWAWSAPVTNGTTVTYRGVATAKMYALSVGGAARQSAYGSTVTAAAPFEERTTGGTNLVYLGWLGTGCVPASGTAREVSFVATGAGALDWVYQTNYWVRISQTVGGSVALVDANGRACPTNEFWTESGSRYFLSARPEDGWEFVGWEVSGASGVETSPALTVMVTAATSVRALFKMPASQVTFVLDACLTRTGGGALVQTVEYGAAAVAPTVEADAAHVFLGWDPKDFSCVTSNMTIRSVVRAKTFSVTFVLGEHLTRTGGGALNQTVAYGAAAVAPTVAADTGYVFAGWDRPFANVTADLTVNGRAETEVTETPYLSADVADGCEEMGTVSGGDKIVRAGKKATVKAKAKKGFVFSAWYEGTALASSSASYSFTMPSHDVSLAAQFITAAEDAASVRLAIDGQTLVGEGGEQFPGATNIWAGVYLEWPVAASARSAVTVKVSGLPSGLKFTAKDVVDRKTGLVTVPANTIYGTPKTGGKTSKVKITVTTAGKTKVTATMAVTVIALPSAMIGTYAGGSTNAPTGSASIKITKACKITGNWISEGLTWKISATGFTEHDAETETFTALATFKAGKESAVVPLVFGLDETGLGLVECDLFSATCVNWKIEPWKSAAAVLKGQTFEFAETGVLLTGKVGASGAVTVTGTFDVGYVASVKSSLVPLGGDRFELFVYFPAKASKGFAGYAKYLVLRWTGGELVVE